MSVIHSLFPTPVMSEKLERDLTDEELKFVNEVRSDLHQNHGNWTSNNSDILGSSRMSDLKEFFIKTIHKYFNEIISTINEVDPYITVSWLNFTDKNGFHHRHVHSNSIISGVFYIQVSETDKIFFEKDKTSGIYFDPKILNMFNASSWWLPAKKNMLLLFPSDLYHSVRNNESDEQRISLSFNVFVRGKLGNRIDLTYLDVR